MSADQATRCPSCKTVFRVVPDQLRVSEGWVRCGRCTHVFNAAENLVDMDGGWARLPEDPQAGPRARSAADIRRTARGPAHRARQDGPDTDRLASKVEAAMARAPQAPQPAPPPSAPDPFSARLPPAPAGPPVAQGTAADTAARAPGSALTFRKPAPAGGARRPAADTARVPTWPAEQGFEQPLRHPDGDDWQPLPPSGPFFESPAGPVASPPPAAEAPVWPASAHDTAPDPLYARLPEPADRSLPFDETRPEMDWAAPAMATSLDDLRADPRGGARTSPAAKPGFMRKAERERQWQQPRRRALLVGAVAGSALLLLTQVAVAYKDLMAARFPGTRPVLEGLCAGLGCTVRAARGIDSLAVESSGLVRVDKTANYQLQVTLRNRANLELALPALDVTFTDSKGDVIARKVLLPQDLGSTIDRKPGSHGGTVAAGREVTLQGTLQTAGGGAEVVAGYTVELFYP